MDARESIDKAKKDLAQLKDELRVKLHLAKKDAQAAWQELEPRINVIEGKLDEASKVVGAGAEKAKAQALDGLSEVRAQWPGLEKAIDQVVTDMKKGATDVKASVDTARVKAHLAAMDGAPEELKKAGAKIKGDLEQAAAEMKTTFEGFAKKLGL
ncbi:MAG TPA: hypothetical protein VGO62_14175 [Myxococcota bacterium]